MTPERSVAEIVGWSWSEPNPPNSVGYWWKREGSVLRIGEPTEADMVTWLHEQGCSTDIRVPADPDFDIHVHVDRQSDDWSTSPTVACVFAPSFRVALEAAVRQVAAVNRALAGRVGETNQ